MEFIVGQFAKPEVFPPRRLFFAAMPFQQLGEKPARAMFIGPFGFVRRERSNEASRELTDSASSAASFSLGSPDWIVRSRQTLAAAFFQFLAPLFQPVPQPPGRNTVVAVVAFDRLRRVADFLATVSQRHRRFKGLESRIRVPQRHSPSEAVERLQSLDGIALDRRSEPLSNDAIEIDEDSGPQQFVNFIDARTVSSRQAA